MHMGTISDHTRATLELWKSTTTGHEHVEVNIPALVILTALQLE